MSNESEMKEAQVAGPDLERRKFKQLKSNELRDSNSN